MANAVMETTQVPAEGEATQTQPVPLPEDVHGWEDRQEAAMLQAEAEGQEYLPPVVLLPTRADVERALARVKFFSDQAADVEAVFDERIKAKEAELAALKQRKADALKPWERRQQWYLMALEQAARIALANDPKAKTQKYPSGDLILRAQQPEWIYGDEKAVAQWLLHNRPELVRPAVDKAELKKLATAKDGQVTLPDTGEVLPGIVVMERPPKFEIKTV